MKKVIGMLLMSVTMLVTVTLTDSVVPALSGTSLQVQPSDYDPGY
ncbi:hypothetical protein [Brevibacillus sp. SKDU10]|nr:hypothetical protein [Brevibacillus sp. SKDU10]